MKKLQKWYRNSKEKDAELKRLIEETKFEKGDVPALVIAAFVSIMPVVILVLGVFVIMTMVFLNLGT